MKFICAMIIFAFIFIIVKPTVIVTLFFAVLGGGAILLSSCWRKNQDMFGFCRILFLSGGVAFVLVKLLDGDALRWPNGWEWGLLVIILGEFVCMNLFRKHRGNVPEALALYPERQYDLERVKTYIMQVNLLGINAPWGVGKSLLVEHLKKDAEIATAFEIIQIDLLTCDLDQVELILIEELDRVFRKNRIHSRSSAHLKELLGKNQWSELLWSMLEVNHAGLSASLESFRVELEKLDKKILLIFEDVDRVAERETIQKIFAIAEKLSCDRLRVIYQYDIHELTKNFDQEYLEKYIPYSVGLTSHTYRKLVELLWHEVIPKEFPLAMKDVQVLEYGQTSREFRDVLGRELNHSIAFEHGVAPRKVKHFLAELNIVISSNPEFANAGTRETVLKIIFIKHFFARYFDLIQIGESPLDTWTLEWEGERKTLPEVLAMLIRREAYGGKQGKQAQTKAAECFQRLLEQRENKRMLDLLLLLGYWLNIEETAWDLGERIAEPENNLKKKEHNEKIDRVVWNVVAGGTSEWTDNENAVRKLKAEVLDKTGEEQAQAWNKYMEDMFHSRLRNGNTTIFFLGVDVFLYLFRAMRMCGVSREDWDHFLDFYFSQQQIEKETMVTRSMIDCCSYCDFQHKSNFFRIVRWFNQLQVTTNFNQERSYQMFFQNAMQAITMHGYCERMEYNMFRLPGKVMDNLEFVKMLLDELQDDLKRNQKKYALPVLREEYTQLICFVQKNRELIGCPNEPPQRGPSVSIKEQTHWIHQEEMDRLKGLKLELSEEAFMAELERSYAQGRIRLSELRAILTGKA